MNNGSNQKITGYIKVSEPTVHNLMSDVNRRVLRITKRKDEIVLDLTVRDKKSHYYYDDYNSKFFMPEPCFNDSCRDIERLCGQDICDLRYGIVSNINSPEIDPFPPIPPPPPPPPPCIGLCCDLDGTFVTADGITRSCRDPDWWRFITPACPPDHVVDQETGKCTKGECPLGFSKFGRAEDNCRGECCICGDVAHCIEISSFKSGFVVRQCTPTPYTPPDGCIDPNYDCNCPVCECEDCTGVEPNDYCYCKCQQPRREPSVEYEICDVKTVIACWAPGGGLVDGYMKFISTDGTTAFLDFERGIFKPGHLGVGLIHEENVEIEDPDYPGSFDSCPQDTAPIYAPCVLACGYGDEFPEFGCIPNDDLIPEVVSEGCSRGQSVYYQYNCYGVLTCPQGSHYSACERVPRLVFSWYPIEVEPINCDGTNGEISPTGGNGYPGSIAGDCGWQPIPGNQPPLGGPRHSPARGCSAREASEDCGELDGDGSLPEEYQTNWGGTLYPPVG